MPRRSKNTFDRKKGPYIVEQFYHGSENVTVEEAMTILSRTGITWVEDTREIVIPSHIFPTSSGDSNNVLLMKGNSILARYTVDKQHLFFWKTAVNACFK